MIFEISVLAAVLFAVAVGVLTWSLAVKPALRRRYERAHFRRKSQRGQSVEYRS